MEFAPLWNAKSRCQLWTDRSPSLLGVRACCWYQNDRSELYFCCVFLVFSFATLLFLVFQKNWQTLCSKTNFFTMHFEMGTGKNVEKSNKYFHDDDAVRLCQNNVLRVSALKIWRQTVQYSKYYVHHQLKKQAFPLLPPPCTRGEGVWPPTR